MKKILLTISLALIVVVCLVLPCFAYSYDSSGVTFTPGYYEIDLDYYYPSAYDSAELENSEELSECSLFMLVDGNEIPVKRIILNPTDMNYIEDYDVYQKYGGVVTLVCYSEVTLSETNLASWLGDAWPNYCTMTSDRNPSDNVLDDILGSAMIVFAFLGTFVVSLISIFWVNGSLTMLGYLAVAGLSITVIMLIVYLISRFLKFRG